MRATVALVAPSLPTPRRPTAGLGLSDVKIGQLFAGERRNQRNGMPRRPSANNQLIGVTRSGDDLRQIRFAIVVKIPVNWRGKLSDRSCQSDPQKHDQRPFTSRSIARYHAFQRSGGPDIRASHIPAVERMASLISRSRASQGRRCASPRSGRQRRSLTGSAPRKILPACV